jgi:Glycogen recognition site of AMP-activated protein kinase
MNDRIQRALDGEFPSDLLTSDERAELHRYRAIFGTALGPIRRLPSIDVAPEVMRRVAPRAGRNRAADAIRKLAGWLWAPRPLSLTVRPALAMAGALAVALAVSISARGASPSVDASPTRVLVQFRLGEAQAREVALVGDFNGWRPEHRMHRSAEGVWSVDVALEPGVYNYVFVVDGETWRLDPLAPHVTDGFGGASSRVAVLAPEARS